MAKSLKEDLSGQERLVFNPDLEGDALLGALVLEAKVLRNSDKGVGTTKIMSQQGGEGVGELKTYE